MASRSLRINLVVQTHAVYEQEPTLEDIHRMFKYGHFGADFVMGEDCTLIVKDDEVLMAAPSSGGHVYDQAKTDEGWKPGQTGGVVTAEPEAVSRAREAGEKQAKDGGGDMKS